MKKAKITVKSFKADNQLLWFNSKSNWRVTCVNTTSADIFVTWNEIDQVITDLKVDETSAAGQGIILDLTGGMCRSYLHTGSPGRRIAPHRFLEIQIPPDKSGEWTMEKPPQSSRRPFSIRSVSLWSSWTHHGAIPEPDERLQPE